MLMIYVTDAFLNDTCDTLCCSITINGNTVACTGSCEAVVDSGTSLIIGPSKDIDNINGWLGSFTDPYGDVSVLDFFFFPLSEHNIKHV